MKSVPKLIRRFIGILLISTFLIITLNIVVLFFIEVKQTASGSPYMTAYEMGKAITKNNDGYILDQDSLDTLHKEKAWAMVIDNETHKVTWHTDDLPESIPSKYSLSDISDLTLGYLDDYPTYTGETMDGLLVIGYPKDRYWKAMWPTWDYNFIANAPKTLLLVLLCNILLIFIIYIAVTGKLIKSVNPIIEGIKGLLSKEKIYVKEKGVLSELALSINQTSETLQLQRRQLAGRDLARANWIAGISHDIRTPLSMVMGYAGQLIADKNLTEEEIKKASVILRQSEKMRNLVNDLNLASKLEYNMQPLNSKRVNVGAIIRQMAAAYLNTNIDDKYKLQWEMDDRVNSSFIESDKELLKRALNNLIQNSVNHNEEGCTIYLSAVVTGDKCTITVEDNGIGASDEEINKLNNTPHYMVCDSNVTNQRHGLGLLIVKQIMAVHHGKTTIEHSKYGGFAVKLELDVQ